MRTLITLSLTFILSSCVGIPTRNSAEEMVLSSDTLEERTDCPGFIQGNYYTYCVERSYQVHEESRAFFRELEEEEEVEAEE